MVSSLEELGDLLENNNLTPADVEFIINFMSKEDISPQLAMRRIKAFETLKAKLEDNKDKEKIDLLEEELHQIKNQLVQRNKELEELRQEKSGLESEKEQLESKSELIEGEREELQRQLEMIRDMQFEEEPDEEERIVTTPIVEFKNELEKLIELNTDFSSIFKPLTSILSDIIENEKYNFDRENYVRTVEQLLEKPPMVDEDPKEIQSQSESSQPKEETQTQTTTSQVQPTAKRKVEEKSKNVKEKKVETTEEKPEKKVTEKEEQVLNLFLEFLDEADSDKSFKERVSTICDMDEAYEYLGSIGLSQVYSYSSRGLDKKEELKQLLNSWKKDGIPR